MEPPECPVCLQPYEFAGDSVPRVLPCGHSACESCICALPRRPAAPSAVRCPACNILVRIPDLGPSALPKNIDLLRLYSNNSRSPGLGEASNPSSKPNPYPILFPLPWNEDLYSKWKDWVLPHDSISLVTFDCRLGYATASFYSSSSSILKNRTVILLPLVALSSFSAQRGPLRLSYVARVMTSLLRMGEDWMNQLGLLLEASSSCRRRISRVFGLWMDPKEELSPLFLVCERFDKGVLDVLNDEKYVNEMVAFAMMAMEMCEAVMSLHSACIVGGCLLLECFVLDELGHCILDLSRVLVSGKRIREKISGTAVSDSPVFASPEVHVSLHGGVSAAACGFDDFVGYGSDVWSLACIIAMILCGDTILGKELFQGFLGIFCGGVDGHLAEILFDHYEVWKEKVVSKLEALLLEAKLESLLQVLKSSLSYQPQNRPQIKQLWSCIRSLLTKTQVASLAAMNTSEVKESLLSCMMIGDMCLAPSETNSISTKLGIDGALVDKFNVGQVCSSRNMSECVKQDRVNADHFEGLEGDGFKSITIEAHNDCITALAVGGGYLFSASFDKTIKVWSLQDFSLVQTLKGHEHKIMAMVVMDGTQPLCISGDSSSGIFVWHISSSAGQELLKSWYEHNDWRYSGIHSLAVSGISHLLYSGGGDKSIKAWSLQDYSLTCVMTGHKSTVSSLASVDGVLYSGSWDGTIRLWSLYDHTLLSELGDNTPGGSYPVLSLIVKDHFVLSSYEDGCIKIWRNDEFVKSIKIQKGAIFALHLDSKWMCTGGWDMIVNIQELLEDGLLVDVRPVASLNFDSVITSLLHWHGKLFVGFSNKIKVFYRAT